MRKLAGFLVNYGCDIFQKREGREEGREFD